MIPIKKFWIVAAIMVLLSAACGRGETAVPTETIDPGAVYTAAAETANARITEILATTPTALPATDTPMPTEAATATQPASLATTAAPAATTAATAAATAGGVSGSPPAGEGAEFVSDVTIPDGTDLEPNESFIKTWRLMNTGSTTWTSDYQVFFVDGAPMNGPDFVPMPGPVAPNETVDIAVQLTAPADPGNYRGNWMIRNPDGQAFGVGTANEPFWVEIDVVAASAGTPQVTIPAQGNGGDGVSNISLSVDEPVFSGDCPHTMDFVAKFTLDGPETVTYGLDAQTGFDMDLPDPVTESLAAGTYSFIYNLTFTAAVEGWARLLITEPDEAVSNRVDFSVTCD